jgi:hypothetical protein
MKQLLNFIFWCLTLCTLAISQPSVNCGDNGTPVTTSCNGGASMCICKDGWRSSDSYETITISGSTCQLYVGSDCSTSVQSF